MGVFDLSSTSRAVRSCSRCVCVGVVGHLHGPALLFGGACFRDPGLASVCVCVCVCVSVSVCLCVCVSVCLCELEQLTYTTDGRLIAAK